MVSVWKYFRLVLLVSLSIFVCSCTQSEKRYEQTVAKMSSIAKVSAIQDRKIAKKLAAKMPSVVSAVLSKPIKINYSSSGKRFDVSANQMPARDFFTYLSTRTGQNIIVSPGLTAKVTLNLTQVTLADVFYAMRDSYGFSIERTKYGYTVGEAKLVTRSYFVAQLPVVRKGTSTMVVSDMNASGSESSSTDSSSSSSSSGTSSNGSESSSVESKFGDNDFWAELQDSIKALIMEGDLKGTRVSLNKANGLIVVKAMPKQQKLVADYIHSINAINSKQVVIDAMVLQVTRTNSEDAGITSLTFPHFNWSSDSGATLSYGTSSSSISLSAVVKFMSTLGKVSLLSRPRISTMNNQKALIKVGTDEYFTLGLNNTTSTSTVTTTSSGFNLQSFFSGIALDITPQVQEDSSIMLHIHPIISTITAAPYTVTEAAGTYTLTVPKTDITETDTLVRASSGQVIVIAGLMRDQVTLDSDALPFANSPKYNKDNSSSKKELFILLKPTLVTNELWSRQLDHIANIYGKGGVSK